MFHGSVSLPMSVSRIASLAVAVLVLGAATDALARTKKHRVERTTTSATMCDGTPIIMQGMDCATRPASKQNEGKIAKRAEGPRLSARGSSGLYVPPVQRPPSLALTQPSAGVYIPPPVNNPSARINQLNQSFPFNAGLGNNPTNRDAYIRYNMTR